MFDLRMVEESLWKSDALVSKAVDKLNKFYLFFFVNRWEISVCNVIGSKCYN